MSDTILVTYRKSRQNGNKKGGQRESHTQPRFVKRPEDAQRKARLAGINAKAAAAFQEVKA